MNFTSSKQYTHAWFYLQYVMKDEHIPVHIRTLWMINFITYRWIFHKRGCLWEQSIRYYKVCYNPWISTLSGGEKRWYSRLLCIFGIGNLSVVRVIAYFSSRLSVSCCIWHGHRLWYNLDLWPHPWFWFGMPFLVKTAAGTVKNDLISISLRTTKCLCKYVLKILTKIPKWIICDIIIH